MSNPTKPPRPIRKAPRGVKYTEEIASNICEQIRTHGVSDSRAGLLAGATAQAVQLWKKRETGFTEKLQRARAEFQRDRLVKIREAAEGEKIDWRAQVWLAEHAGTGTGLPDKADEDAADLETAPSPLFAVTPEQLVMLQQRRAVALEKMKP